MTEQSTSAERPSVSPAEAFKPGGVVGPQQPAPIQTEMALKELHQSGLLWHINKALLWDLGLALAVDVASLKPGEGENSRIYRRLLVIDHTPPHRIVDLDDSLQFEAYQRWLSTRIGTIR